SVQELSNAPLVQRPRGVVLCSPGAAMKSFWNHEAHEGLQAHKDKTDLATRYYCFYLIEAL
ncbi:MAG: hypothetical protein ACLFVW_01465, partial [Phycisphaerae bacterium]